jgi:hypothetical protein
MTAAITSAASTDTKIVTPVRSVAAEMRISSVGDDGVSETSEGPGVAGASTFASTGAAAGAAAGLEAPDETG